MGGFNLDDYEPVDVRLRKFWQENPKGRVVTNVEVHDGVALARCTLLDQNGEGRSTGHAGNKLDQAGRTAQATHPIEDAETSAIGRALANWVYASEDKPRPSREEMEAPTLRIAPVDLLYLTTNMTDAEKEAFRVGLHLQWPGIGLKIVHPDIAEAVILFAQECTAERHAEPAPLAKSSPEDHFSEEPF